MKASAGCAVEGKGIPSSTRSSPEAPCCLTRVGPNAALRDPWGNESWTRWSRLPGRSVSSPPPSSDRPLSCPHPVRAFFWIGVVEAQGYCE